jgi:ribose 5-phosphate isomerase B
MKKNGLKIAVGSDHAGYELKEYLRSRLALEGHIISDFGTDSPKSADYADYVHPLAREVAEGKHVFGLVMCGSGNGVNMTANQHRGIRSALCWTPEIARLARAHNDANVLALPARFISPEQALEILRVFLDTDFEGGRHATRVSKIPCS